MAGALCLIRDCPWETTNLYTDSCHSGILLQPWMKMTYSSESAQGVPTLLILAGLNSGPSGAIQVRSLTFSLFAVVIFLQGSHTFCLLPTWDSDPPTSASCVAGIIDVRPHPSLFWRQMLTKYFLARLASNLYPAISNMHVRKSPVLEPKFHPGNPLNPMQAKTSGGPFGPLLCAWSVLSCGEGHKDEKDTLKLQGPFTMQIGTDW
jgi:hypothetical protein